MIFASQPVGLPGLATFALGSFGFLAALLHARARRGAPDPGQSRRSPRSWVGVLLQGVGIGAAGFGPIRPALDPLAGAAIAEAAVVTSLLAAAIALFVGATRVMGRNWSLEARTRSDHELITGGPFRYVRHPIYVALWLYLLASSLALGHWQQLMIGVPLYALGTWLRIRDEEALLRLAFRDAWDAYAARTARFLPGVV